MSRLIPCLLPSLVWVLALATPLHAQPSAFADTTIAAAATADSMVDSIAIAAPTPAPDPMAEARGAFTAENRQYQRMRVWLRLVGPIYGVLAGLMLMFTGLSARFRDIAHALGERRYVRVLVYFMLYSCAVFMLSLPLAWYEEYALEHQYALSNQTWIEWLIDSVKGLVFTIVAVGVVPLLSLAWSAIEHWPRTYWRWLALGTLPVAVAGTLLQPLVLDPIFNRFTPLADASLKGEILALGARAGIPGRRVYQVDMSTKTNKLNAYVNGFGASQRIVLWDTTLQKMKRDEILFVMGHEMGHYVLNHIWKSLAAIGLGAFLAWWLAAKLVQGLLALFGDRWGVHQVSDLAAMPVLALAFTLVTLAAQPAMNAMSRLVEHESDIYALELTRDNDAAQRAFLKLAEGN
ncbi:MAG: M48 family metallopeptidase, partial [Candidatus Eisenbacteria bacterium]